MEIEQSTQVVSNKIWSILRIVFFMIRRGLSKEFHTLLKRGKLASKAIANNFLLNQSSSLSCRSNNTHLSYVSPKEYEFSCSNSPANFNPFHNFTKKKHFSKSYQYDDVNGTVSAVQKMLEKYLNSNSNSNSNDNINNNNINNIVEASPLVTLPGFGNSPLVRQLRITDSPFPLKDDGGDCQVDKQAEEFIKSFYKNLKSQRQLVSPAHYLWGR